MFRRILSWLLWLMLLGTGCPFLAPLAEPILETVQAPAASTEITEDSGFTVTFLDVGQAESTVVECDGHFLLIDGGNKDDSSFLYSYLIRNGIRNLDAVISTHPHEDHIGGLPAAFSACSVGIVYSPVSEYDSSLFQKLKNRLKRTEMKVPDIGESFQLGSAEVQFLNTGKTYENLNAGSLAAKITYGNTAFLFMADTMLETEKDILDAGYNVKADVIKVGHHGANGSTGYRFLRESKPEIAVISVGLGNDYGHPSDAVLSCLKDAGAAVYRTDRNGTIHMESDGEQIRVKVEKTVSAEEAEAQMKRKNGTSSDGYPYVGNLYSKKFHREDCTSAKKISGYNRVGFENREEAIREGYTPCKCCKP